MAARILETRGIRLAVEGCGHGTLNAIYASVAQSCKARGWPGVDLVVIGGDFQAVRNAADLTVMSVPLKYRQLGDFADYYSGARAAPYPTAFISGNHEASSHLWELYYGGWVAPNIYYLGAANVLRFGPIRIAGLSGIWKGFDYRKTHHERLPFNSDDVKSFYHVREIDVRKLLLMQTQVDVGLSHDWPRGIERHGNFKKLFKKKPDFKEESKDGTLGSVAAEYVMDRLRPPYWFSAHLHVKFAALKTYQDAAPATHVSNDDTKDNKDVAAAARESEANPDEIDLEMDDSDKDSGGAACQEGQPDNNSQEADKTTVETTGVETNHVSDDMRAQLPASFAPPEPKVKRNPGQPVPPGITNKEVRFLALDKCLPGRNFLQLCEIEPYSQQELSTHSPKNKTARYHFQYDPEWLSITRAFHKFLTIGDRNAQTPENLGEEQYLSLIETERAWVDEHIVNKGKLDVPKKFQLTAPPHVAGSPEIVHEQPEEYTNPQTAAFCELLGIENLWDASAEERRLRREQGPPPSEFRGGSHGDHGRGRGGRGGRGRGRGGRGRGQRSR